MSVVRRNGQWVPASNTLYVEVRELRLEQTASAQQLSTQQLWVEVDVPGEEDELQSTRLLKPNKKGHVHFGLTHWYDTAEGDPLRAAIAAALDSPDEEDGEIQFLLMARRHEGKKAKEAGVARYSLKKLLEKGAEAGPIGIPVINHKGHQVGNLTCELRALALLREITKPPTSEVPPPTPPPPTPPPTPMQKGLEMLPTLVKERYLRHRPSDKLRITLKAIRLSEHALEKLPLRTNLCVELDLPGADEPLLRTKWVSFRKGGATSLSLGFTHAYPAAEGTPLRSALATAFAASREEDAEVQFVLLSRASGSDRTEEIGVACYGLGEVLESGADLPVTPLELHDIAGQRMGELTVAVGALELLKLIQKDNEQASAAADGGETGPTAAAAVPILAAETPPPIDAPVAIDAPELNPACETPVEESTAAESSSGAATTSGAPAADAVRTARAARAARGARVAHEARVAHAARLTRAARVAREAGATRAAAATTTLATATAAASKRAGATAATALHEVANATQRSYVSLARLLRRLSSKKLFNDPPWAASWLGVTVQALRLYPGVRGTLPLKAQLYIEVDVPGETDPPRTTRRLKLNMRQGSSLPLPFDLITWYHVAEGMRLRAPLAEVLQSADAAEREIQFALMVVVDDAEPREIGVARYGLGRLLARGADLPLTPLVVCNGSGRRLGTITCAVRALPLLQELIGENAEQRAHATAGRAPSTECSTAEPYTHARSPLAKRQELQLDSLAATITARPMKDEAHATADSAVQKAPSASFSLTLDKYIDAPPLPPEEGCGRTLRCAVRMCLVHKPVNGVPTVFASNIITIPAEPGVRAGDPWRLGARERTLLLRFGESPPPPDLLLYIELTATVTPPLERAAAQGTAERRQNRRLRAPTVVLVCGWAARPLEEVFKRTGKPLNHIERLALSGGSLFSPSPLPSPQSEAAAIGFSVSTPSRDQVAATASLPADIIIPTALASFVVAARQLGAQAKTEHVGHTRRHLAMRKLGALGDSLDVLFMLLDLWQEEPLVEASTAAATDAILRIFAAAPLELERLTAFDSAQQNEERSLAMRRFSERCRREIVAAFTQND